MYESWEIFKPSVALVEGRLGFLFSWIQNPVKKLGEGGLTAKLAKSDRIKLYSWEPGRDAEVNYLLRKYDRINTAAIFCLRPYLNNVEYNRLSQDEQDKIMRKFILERTTNAGINGAITKVEQIDSLWMQAILI